MLGKIGKDVFLKNNTIFFVGSIAVAFVNYLFHPLLARLMTASDFGEVQSLNALYIQFGIILGVLSFYSINLVANSREGEEQSAAILIIEKMTIIISAVLGLIILLFSNYLRVFFAFSSFSSFIILAGLLPLGAIFTIRSSILQGAQKFTSTAFAAFIVAIGRLLFAVLFVYFGWRSFGAIFGLFIAQIAGLIYLYLETKNYHPGLLFKDLFSVVTSHKTVANIKRFFFIFIGLVLVTFLYTGDVLIIKHFFNPEQAGLYSGISTIAKIVFFLVGPIAGVLLPNIKLSNSSSENERFLIKSLLLASIVGGAACIFFNIFPVFTIKLLIGSRYLSVAYLLPKLSFLMFLASIINLFLFYFLALRRHFFVLILAIGLGVGLIFSRYQFFDLIGVINSFLASAISVLLILSVVQLKTRYAKTRFHNSTDL